MTDFIREEFPDASIVDAAEDGINESYYFDSSISGSSKRYVGKLFSSNMIDTEDYLASIEVARNHVFDGEYLHTPRIVCSGIFDGDAYLIYEYIDGLQLQFENLQQDNSVEKYIDRIGKVMAELHQSSSPVSNFGWYTIDGENIRLKNGYEDSLGLTLSQVNYNISMLDNSTLESEIADRVRDVLESNLQYQGDPVVAHCDIKYNNAIDTDGTGDELYLIDWEFIRSADPLYDYVKTERSLIRRYDHQSQLSDGTIDSYCQVLRESYFESAPTSFSRDRYVCYWLQEMIECLESCSDWYPENELDDVRQYYKSEITNYLQELE